MGDAIEGQQIEDSEWKTRPRWDIIIRARMKYVIGNADDDGHGVLNKKRKSSVI